MLTNRSMMYSISNDCTRRVLDPLEYNNKSISHSVMHFVARMHIGILCLLATHNLGRVYVFLKKIAQLFYLDSYYIICKCLNCVSEPR